MYSSKKHIVTLVCMLLLSIVCFAQNDVDEKVLDKMRAFQTDIGEDTFIPKWNEAFKYAVDEQACEESIAQLWFYKSLHFYNSFEIDSMKTCIDNSSKFYKKVVGKGKYRYYFMNLLLCDAYVTKFDFVNGIKTAESIYKEAKAENNETGIAYGGYAIATVYMGKSSYKEAADKYVEVIPQFNDIKAWNLFATSIGNGISALVEINDYKTAEKIFLYGDSIANIYGFPQNSEFDIISVAMIKSFCSARIYSRLNRRDMLKKYYEETKSLYKEYGDNLPQIYKYSNYKAYAHIEKNYKVELQYIDSCLTFYEDNEDKLNVSSSILEKSKCLERMGRYRDALQYQRRHEELNDSISAADQKADLDQLATEYGVYKLESANQKLLIQAQKAKLRLILIILIAVSIVLAISIFYNGRMKKLNIQLEEANSVKAKFINNMTHEIRTPLNAIMGFSEILTTSIKTVDEDELEMLKAIENGGNELLKIVDDTLYLADYESNLSHPLKINEIDVSSFCSDFISNMKTLYEARINCNSFEVLRFKTSDIDLSRILENFVLNAIKFGDGKGIDFEYHYNDDKKQIQFWVTNTGCRIAPSNKERIFDCFYKEDIFSQGLGVGLYICRLAAKRMNATVGYDSNYHEGTRFYCTINIA